MLFNYYMTLLVFIIQFKCVKGLTCSNIVEMPEHLELSMNDLKTLQTKEIIACLIHLGRKELSTPVAEYIWHSITEYYYGAPYVQENVLMHLGFVTAAIKPEEYANMSLSSIDVVRNFGRDYNLNYPQLSAIANQVREDFANKQPEDYTFLDLTALRQILCAFNRSEIERIHSSAYRDAALVIGKLKRCSTDVMKGFTTLAVQKHAFGSPENWTKATLRVVGQIFYYLPENIRKNIARDKKISFQSTSTITYEPVD